MVLERLRDNLTNRDGELEKAITRENRWTRGTLVIVGATSLAALIISIAMVLYGWSAIARVADSVNVRQSSQTLREAPVNAPQPEIAVPAPASQKTHVSNPLAPIIPTSLPVVPATTRPADEP